jgi:hypothetical protein
MLPAKPKTKKAKEELAIAMAKFKKEQVGDVKLPSAPLLEPDPNLPTCIIVDIDGTLAERGERAIFDFDHSMIDKVFLPVKYILTLIDDANKYNSRLAPLEIVIITGREEKDADITNQWLNKHQIPFDHMYTRRNGDRRASEVVKEEIWAANIRGKYNVFFVLEDYGKCVEMFRSHGYYVLKADNSRERA